VPLVELSRGGERHSVRKRGARLFYRVAGEGSTLLLVPGLGPDSRGWSTTFEKLAENHRVVAYDRRGYGRSSPPSDGGWRTHGEDAAALIDELELSPATVVGWSGGGYVAIHLAVETPQLVRNLVLAETGLPLPPAATASYLLMFLRAQVIGRLRGHRAGRRPSCAGCSAKTAPPPSTARTIRRNERKSRSVTRRGYGRT
jgi:pimeloyl-ACP methyl ester carboxylesterase